MADGRAKAPRRSGTCGRRFLSRSDGSAERIREWQFALPVVGLRAVLIAGLLYPVMAIFSRRRTYGRDVLGSLDGPVIFAANHLSVADNPAVLLALPWRWRLRLATAASREVMHGRGEISELLRSPDQQWLSDFTNRLNSRKYGLLWQTHSGRMVLIVLSRGDPVR